MSLRVAYIISQYPEFHETFVAREVNAMRLKGIKFRLFSLKNPKPFERALYPDHIQLIEYSPLIASIRLILANAGEFFSSPLRYLAAVTWLIRSHYMQPLELLKSLAVLPKTVLFAKMIRGNFDLLHAHWATIPAAMAVVVNTLTGIRFSITAHAWDIFLSPPQLLREKISKSSGIITCTGYNVKYLKTICASKDKDKIFRNYHGLDIATFPTSSTILEKGQPLRIIAIGRLVEQKGFIYLIRAVKILAEQGVHLHLSIIGEGPLRNQLQKEAYQARLLSKVDILGRLPHEQTIATLRESHIMVAPSVIAGDGNQDGIPNVILEGMACALPVIATNISGIPEVILHKKTGYLVEPSNVPALVDAILDVISFPEQAKAYGIAGRRFVEKHFDISKNIEQLFLLLQQFAATNYFF